MEKRKNWNRDHGRACMLCASVCLKKKHNARNATGSPRQQCIGAISAFVDSIDSHIILRMIRESIKSKSMTVKVDQKLVRVITTMQYKRRSVSHGHGIEFVLFVKCYMFAANSCPLLWPYLSVSVIAILVIQFARENVKGGWRLPFVHKGGAGLFETLVREARGKRMRREGG